MGRKKTAIPEWVPGYKVLFPMKTCRRRVSTATPTWLGGRDYPVGTVVTPRPGFGPLAVFSRREDAEEFTLYYSSVLVVPCAYVPSRLRFVQYTDPFSGWTHKRELGDLPPGTRLADAVFCLE